jgi:hypothetical protein
MRLTSRSSLIDTPIFGSADSKLNFASIELADAWTMAG